MRNLKIKPRQTSSLIILFFFIYILQGCGSITSKSNFSEEGILLAQANKMAKDDVAWFDEANVNREELMLQYAGELSPSIAFYLERDLHIHDDKHLSTYLLKIVTRLLEGWEGIRPEITVVIESDEFLNAFISEYNQIHVSTGTFRVLENEDQLASLLAHEISHALLNHNYKKNLVRSTISALEFGELLAADVGSFAGQIDENSEVEEHSEDTELGFASLGFIWADLFAPNWSRENELEADRMGMDLVMQAGYNFEEYPVMIEMLHEAETKRSERLKQVSKKIDEVIQNNLINPGSNEWERIVDAFKVNLATRAKNKILDEIALLGKEHEDRETRIDVLKSYINAEYSDEWPPEASSEAYRSIINSGNSKTRLDQDLKANKIIDALNNNDFDLAKSKARDLRIDSQTNMVSGVIAKSSTEILNKNSATAINYLARLISERSHAPTEAYTKLAELYAAKKNYDKADQVLQQGIKRIGRDYKFLPTLVWLNMKSGNVQEAENYTLECQKYDSDRKDSIIMSIIGASSIYYEKCASVLGYDVRTKKNPSLPIWKILKENLDSPIKEILNSPQ